MNTKLLTEHHFGSLILKGGCAGLSESIHVKMPHCWKSHVVAHFVFTSKRNLSVFTVIFWSYRNFNENEGNFSRMTYYITLGLCNKTLYESSRNSHAGPLKIRKSDTV